MRLRFGLAAWSNAHFDNALFPLGTLHEEYLPRYSRLFDAAEADILHHQAAEEGALQQWVQRTPPGFLFLPKLHKSITHEGVPIKATRAGAARMAWLHPQVLGAPPSPAATMEGAGLQARAFLDRLAPLAQVSRLGPVLVQVPPELTRTAGWDRVLGILACAPAGTFAVEVRHPSWFVPAFEAMLEDFDAPLVWSTFPGAFAPPWRTASRGYVRLTGKARPKRGRHVTVADRTPELRELAGRLRQATWDEAFVISTNGFEGNAVDTLPKAAAAFGADDLVARLSRPPGQVLFP